MFPPNCAEHETTVAATIGHDKKSESAVSQSSNTGPVVTIGDSKRMRSTVDSSNPTHGLDSKYRHFSFIPISPGPKSPLSSAHTIYETHLTNQSLQNGSSIFQSPTHKSLSFPKQVNNKSNSHKAGTSNHMYTSARNDISASAPVSPSIVSNQLRFNLLNENQLAGNTYTRANNTNQLAHCQLGQTSEQVRLIIFAIIFTYRFTRIFCSVLFCSAIRSMFVRDTIAECSIVLPKFKLLCINSCD